MNAYEYLLEKGVKKVHQPQKNYNISVAELVEFLEEFAQVRKVDLNKTTQKTTHRNL